MTRSHDSHAFRHGKRQQRLRRLVGEAIADYQMIEAGDTVMVCLSGGKDSYAMLDLLHSLHQAAPIAFHLIAVNLDQKQPGFPADVLPTYMQKYYPQIPFYVIERDTYSTVRRLIPEGKTTCSLCSRLRRGTLYGFAEAHDVTKIALGHHRDDILETLFLNLFFGSKLKTMPPKLVSDDQRHVVIRPLAYCRETDLDAYAEERAFPIIPCHLCGSQPNLKRAEIKAMLAQWQQQFPGRVENLFRGLQDAVPSHLLDRSLHCFESPSPSALRAFRAEHPVDRSRSDQMLAESDLNPWNDLAEAMPTTQIIASTGTNVQIP
jgi:tRNA 2-thiocytidine biosynthesis protein TtcA